MPDGVPITSLRVNGQSVEAQPTRRGRADPARGSGGSAEMGDCARRFFHWLLSTRFEIKAAKLASDVTVGKYTVDHPWWRSPGLSAGQLRIAADAELCSYLRPEESPNATLSRSRPLYVNGSTHPTRLTNQPKAVPLPPRCRSVRQAINSVQKFMVCQESTSCLHVTLAMGFRRAFTRETRNRRTSATLEFCLHPSHAETF